MPAREARGPPRDLAGQAGGRSVRKHRVPDAAGFFQPTHGEASARAGSYSSSELHGDETSALSQDLETGGRAMSEPPLWTRCLPISG